ncbi:MAG: chemotaxis protein CheW [Bacillota bacterium]
MSGYSTNEPMLEMFIFETSQNTEQLEKIILSGEKTSGFTKDEIDEIFRIMHTIKGSSAMMSYAGISSLSHKIEDLFFYIRENPDTEYDCSLVSDLILESIDFINSELEKIKDGTYDETDVTLLVDKIASALEAVRSGGTGMTDDMEDTGDAGVSGMEEAVISDAANLFKVVFYFQDGCDMENIRAFNLVFLLKKHAAGIRHFPEDIEENEASSGVIRENGFIIFFKTDLSVDEVNGFFAQEVFVKDFVLTQFETEGDFEKEMASLFGLPGAGEKPPKEEAQKTNEDTKTAATTQREQTGTVHQSIISVNVSKLDLLMDMIGELVIAESMVVHNPDLNGLGLENFQKSAHQLHKITSELQDLAMSMRMVPLTNTFHKMNRIVRDMSKKVGKDVVLEINGGETEVDKNIIDHISDPLMHLVRNALDHGIESQEERLEKGKSAKGTVMLGARNEGGEIQIFVRDDGKGLNKEKLLERAKKNGLLTKPESEMSEKEIFHLIFHPGFSTNDTVTEYSGRGVGMDVVLNNIEELGGRVTVDSVEHKGTQFTIHFPMTLAIIDGMNVRVGNCTYTLPITVIKETIKPVEKDIIRDPQNNEMILFRGECCPIVRLHKLYGVEADTETISEGVIVMVESGEKMAGVFVDELIGENQVVVKALPKYINSISGIAGCTILGDGSISLILDVAGLAA